MGSNVSKKHELLRRWSSWYQDIGSKALEKGDFNYNQIWVDLAKRLEKDLDFQELVRLEYERLKPILPLTIVFE